MLLVVRMGFVAHITALVLCSRSRDSELSVSLRSIAYMSCSRLLDLRLKESRVLKYVKPPFCREASRMPRAHGRVRTQAVGALAHGFPVELTGRPSRAPYFQFYISKPISKCTNKHQLLENRRNGVTKFTKLLLSLD